MAKPWDDTLKKLVHANPHSFVQWLLPHATYTRELPTALAQEELRVDALLEVVANNRSMLLHIEFQTHNDKAMRDRLLRYNVIIRTKYKLPVWSCVIYLLKGGDIKASPLEWDIPTGQDVIKFYFQNIELASILPEELLRLQLIGLLPLLPLTRGGADRTIVTRMFQEISTKTELEDVERKDLELIGYTLASLVLKRANSSDLEWLMRSFREMHEILRDTPIFQEIMREGREEGREEGLLEGTQHTLLLVVQARFPELARLAEEQVKRIEDVHVLEQCIFKIAAATSIVEATQYLLSSGEFRPEN